MARVRRLRLGRYRSRISHTRHRLRRSRACLWPHRTDNGVRHGHVSGCHLNPAVSIGLVVAKRFPAKELPAYITAQIAGGIFAAAALYKIAAGKPDFVLGGFASNGYGVHSPGGYDLVSCFIIEVILTAFFLLVILGSTDERAPKGFAPIAIGLALTLIHLISIPVTNTSVNPARSTAMAIFVQGWALSQLWLFWLAPILGAIAGAIISTRFFAAPQESVREAMAKD